MNATRKSAVWTPIVCLLAALPALAGSHTSRTYFGRPGLGPYGEPQRYFQPWTAKVMGFRCCNTPEENYQRFLQQYQVVQARHQVALNRLNWDAYQGLQNAQVGSQDAYLGVHNCGGKGMTGGNGPLGFLHGHGKCGSGKCGHKGCGVAGCDGGAGCSHSGKHHLFGKLFGRNNGAEPNYPVVPPEVAAYPGMNREDAVRYIEGFQYYPPYHILRSPRDFYMWDTKYDLGR
jgi:hypothetical protein